MISYNTLLVLLGASLLGASSGLVGSFAVLRRRALLGDALAHAALPGLCLAFLIVGQRSLPALLLGALATGLLGVGIISGLRRWTRIREDAGIGIVLSVFFGAGIVLMSVIQNSDRGGSRAGLDGYILGKTAGIIAQDVYLIAGISLVSLIILAVLYKELKLVAFDADFANVQGWPAGALDMLLMGLIAVTVMIGLPAVGVVLMAALLILPAAAARFWTEHLWRMLLIAACFGLVTGAIGTAISANYSRMPAGPIIVLVGAALFLLSVLFAPRRGGLSRWFSQLAFRRKTQRQHLLVLLYDMLEGAPAGASFRAVDVENALAKPAGETARRLNELRQNHLLELVGQDQYRFTSQGWLEASGVARGQRLWMLFLENEPDAASSIVDLDSEAIDRLLPAERIAELERQLAAEARLPVLAPLRESEA